MPFICLFQFLVQRNVFHAWKATLAVASRTCRFVLQTLFRLVRLTAEQRWENTRTVQGMWSMASFEDASTVRVGKFQLLNDQLFDYICIKYS